MTMQPIDCQMCNTWNRWHAVGSHINHIETTFVHSIIVCNKSNTLFWHPLWRLYALSFASSSFVTSQFLINYNVCYLSEKWNGPITLQRFRPVIDIMWIISLGFGKYSLTASPFLIQLLLLDFHDVPEPISNISTMCTPSVRRVIQLDSCMNAAWQLSFNRFVRRTDHSFYDPYVITDLYSVSTFRH
jgi:hypothetical protein